MSHATGLVIEKDHIYRRYGESKEFGHKTKRDEILTHIKRMLEHAEILNESTNSKFQIKSFRFILQYRCKHFERQPLFIKFYRDPTDSSLTNYLAWNNAIYLFDEKTACRIGALFNPDISNSPLVDGHHYEIIQNPDSRQLSAEYWTEWDTIGSVRRAATDHVTQKAVQQYTNVIHPAIWEYVNDWILKYSSVRGPDSLVRVLDVGGGRGSLAEMIINTNFQQIEQYLILENNQREVSDARKRLAKCKKPQIAIVEQKDATAGDSFQQTNPSIIIACGLLTHFVLPDRSTALCVIDHLSRIAPPGCYLLITGHAPSYIYADDLTARGWEVKNTYCPCYGIHFYVAVRKG